MALSAVSLRNYDLGETNEFGVKASAVIYQGAALGSSGGYARPLTAGDVFLGFALETVTGTGADGGVNVRVRESGKVQLAVTSVAVTDIGKPVWASDDGTFALTSNSGANTKIGTVHRFISSGVAIVKFDATSTASLAGLVELTDNSGGTASDTIPAQTGSYVEATQETTVASLAGKINEIIRALQ